MAPRTLLLRTRDPLVERRVARVAERLGLQALQAVAPPGGDGSDEPAGLLLALDLDDALEVLREWRAAHPRLPILGYVALPEPELWKSAEEAGADIVTTRGLADRELERLVSDHLSGRTAARRIRLAPYKDFAGRLGHVGRLDETPCGPIGIYHLAGRIHALADACPHAGASLCDGEIEAGVVTCPRHGSQFRIDGGERLRGPSDLPVRTFKVVVESGEVFVELPAEG